MSGESNSAVTNAGIPLLFALLLGRGSTLSARLYWCWLGPKTRGSVVLDWRSWDWSPSHGVGELSKSFLWGAVLNVVSSFISSGDIDSIFIVGLMLSVLNAHTSC